MIPPALSFPPCELGEIDIVLCLSEPHLHILAYSTSLRIFKSNTLINLTNLLASALDCSMPGFPVRAERGAGESSENSSNSTRGANLNEVGERRRTLVLRN
ncbi:uncharacterized protein LOC143179257 [Calliopsis andreniformis]|uniref:uncharacterized protein LOC143179257 n=1 Tax=Calliopsis andreniformis TaxID=337506 RepID=UPI003FCED7E8